MILKFKSAAAPCPARPPLRFKPKVAESAPAELEDFYTCIAQMLVADLLREEQRPRMRLKLRTPSREAK